MELKFTEIDDFDNNNNYFDVNSYNLSQSGVVNTNNYWEKSKEIKQEKQEKQEIKSKKKRVTYDDILTSLNLAVSPNGVLQYMTVNPNNDDLFLQSQYQPQEIKNRNISNSLQNQKPLEPQVKNSYIFNKYFKDYKETNIQIEEPKRPQTIEEYNKMVLEERIRRMKEKNRIAQIKSTKLLFENNSTINVSTNNLRRMPFN